MANGIPVLGQFPRQNRWLRPAGFQKSADWPVSSTRKTPSNCHVCRRLAMLPTQNSMPFRGYVSLNVLLIQSSVAWSAPLIKANRHSGLKHEFITSH